MAFYPWRSTSKFSGNPKDCMCSQILSAINPCFSKHGVNISKEEVGLYFSSKVRIYIYKTNSYLLHCSVTLDKGQSEKSMGWSKEEEKKEEKIGLRGVLSFFSHYFPIGKLRKRKTLSVVTICYKLPSILGSLITKLPFVWLCSRTAHELSEQFWGHLNWGQFGCWGRAI